MTDSKSEIKRRLPIAEVISGYVKLQKAGTNYKALCPFHNEKTPSFTVSPDKDMWYCFGCGEGGDVFSFVQKIEGMEFIDSLRMLAEKAGVELRPQDKEISSKRKKLLQIIDLASKFFEKQLVSTTGKKVAAYLKSRGLEESTIQEWRLGYAPDDWGSLYNFLTLKGYSPEDIEATGLTIKSEKPARGRSHHDRFRHRIMFPIYDVNGNIVGFSGRLFEEVKSKTVGEEAGKYINTPQTQLYDKSHILYGLHEAKKAIKKKDSCMLVEGNIDLILAHQTGDTHALAPCGTAVGRGHFELIKRYSQNVTFCFDADSAGVSATTKSAKLALSEGLNVSVVTLPKGKDVADIISSNVDLWRKQQAQPLSYVEFILQTAKDTYPPSNAQGKKKYVHAVLPTIKALRSPVEQAHWLQELSQEVGMEEDVLREEMKSLPEDDLLQEEPITKVGADKSEAPQAVEEYMVVLMFKNPNHARSIKDSIELPELFENEQLRVTVVKLLKGLEPKQVIAEDETLRPLLFASEVIDVILDERSIPDEMDRIILFLRKRHVSSRLKDLQMKLQKAEKAGDSADVTRLVKEFTTLSKKLSASDKTLPHKQKIHTS